MLARLLRRFRVASPPVTPQLDETVAARLAAAGQHPDRVAAEAAEPKEIPAKPALDGFRGMIRFELTLDAQGQVVAVQMDGAPYDVVTALEAWAYGWSFTPARLEGRPHACRMVYEVHWS